MVFVSLVVALCRYKAVTNWICRIPHNYLGGLMRQETTVLTYRKHSMKITLSSIVLLTCLLALCESVLASNLEAGPSIKIVIYSATVFDEKGVLSVGEYDPFGIDKYLSAVSKFANVSVTYSANHRLKNGEYRSPDDQLIITGGIYKEFTF